MERAGKVASSFHFGNKKEIIGFIFAAGKINGLSSPHRELRFYMDRSGFG